jgi:hypothetical protein
VAPGEAEAFRLERLTKQDARQLTKKGMRLVVTGGAGAIYPEAQDREAGPVRRKILSPYARRLVGSPRFFPLSSGTAWRRDQKKPEAGRGGRQRLACSRASPRTWGNARSSADQFPRKPFAGQGSLSLLPPGFSGLSPERLNSAILHLRIHSSRLRKTQCNDLSTTSW